MPPEPFPWDRKDFFKERKHERSESLGSVARWRESSSSHHGGSRGFTRWGSGDFRRPPGHGKQGGWHLFPDESGHGYTPSRSADKLSDDDNSRRPVFRGEGKYNRSYRDNRGSFGQREWKGTHTWETNNGSLHTPHTPGRPVDASNSQRSVDLIMYTSPPHSDSGNGWDCRQLHSKEQYDKTSGVNGPGTGHKCDAENSLGLDWKPVKWSRSGSLSSRGSGLSHSSSSKSMGGVDSIEANDGTVVVNVTTAESPSGDAAVCATSSGPFEEMTSRKKPRLGWGEGLAKYEKKKVDGPEESASKSGAEPAQSLGISIAEKSPRFAGFSDCASPATPSSVACSSSPGLEEKPFVKTVNIDSEVNNICESVDPGSQNQQEGFSFNLEKLDLSSLGTLGYALAELLQTDDASSVESCFMRSTAVNKLLLLKVDVLKTLEVTESEIDSLENELKTLISRTVSSCPCTASSSSMSVEVCPKSCDDGENVSNITRPAPLQLVSSHEVGEGERPVCNGQTEEIHVHVKDDDVDSPGTATSKFVEPIILVNTADSSNMVAQCKLLKDFDATPATEIETNLSVGDALLTKTERTACSDNTMALECKNDGPVNDANGSRDNMLYHSILASNREAANNASEAFTRLLARNQCDLDISRVGDATCHQNDLPIQEKFAKRNRFVKFKERVMTLKFRAFHHLWKEDLRLLSLRKSRAKSQKKFESSLRITINGYQKHRSSIRSRFCSPVGNLSLVPTKEIITYTGKLLSDSRMRHFRDYLKMPALILDEREKNASRFISTNGLVEDPCALEKERKMINPWTAEEREIFLDKFATFGKDFRKIASFLDHKTTADCVQFYYKNHKSDDFEKTKKKLELGKNGKSLTASTYLVASGKKWNREVNTISLDVLGDASLLAAQADGNMLEEQMFSGRFSLAGGSSSKTPQGNCGVLERTSSLNLLESERETVAADVLAGICGSLSSEAMGSCVTSSMDPGEGHRELKYHKVDTAMKRPLTPDVFENLEDETCSGESCGELEPSDWTDEEKTAFIQAVSSYGKDFSMISRRVRTRSIDQCKVFFSKARKCLGLDMMHPRTGCMGSPATDDTGGVDSDTEDACAVENASAVCSDNGKVSSQMDEDLPPSLTKADDAPSEPLKSLKMENDVGREEETATTSVERIINVPALDNVQTKEGGLESASGGDGPPSEPMKPNDSAFLVEEKEPMEEDLNALPFSSSTADAKSNSKACADGSDRLPGKYPLLEKNEADEREPTNVQFAMQKMNSTKDSTLLAATTIPVGFSLNTKPEEQLSLQWDSKESRSFVVPLLQPRARSLPPDSAIDQCEKSKVQGGFLSSSVDLRKDVEKFSCAIGEVDSHRHLSGHALGDLESLHILRGYPVQISKEMKGDSFPDVNPTLQKADGGLNGYMAQGCYLRKCNSSQQTNAPPNSQVKQNSSDTEKQSGTGDFKLFGQILSNNPQAQPKPPNSTAQENDEKEALPPKFTVKPSNHLNGCSNRSGDGSSTLLNFEHTNSFTGLGSNVPLRNIGFWDGKRMQTGFSSLPDSALLLAKYPAAFSNYPVIATAKSGSNECNLNGPGLFPPTRELPSNGNGVVDYQLYRNRETVKLQPFTLEVKPRQDASYPEMPRCNGYDALSSLQQLVGRSGVLVGGPCNGVSDPVAAIKMHYAQSEQMGGGQNGTIREEESWRGKGDIGR